MDTCHLKDFYPSQKIITEGTNDLALRIIVSGTCNLLCINVADKFKRLQRVEDPTLVKREAEAFAMLNPNYSRKVKDKLLKTQLVK